MPPAVPNPLFRVSMSSSEALHHSDCVIGLVLERHTSQQCSQFLRVLLATVLAAKAGQATQPAQCRLHMLSCCFGTALCQSSLISWSFWPQTCGIWPESFQVHVLLQPRCKKSSAPRSGSLNQPSRCLCYLVLPYSLSHEGPRRRRKLCPKKNSAILCHFAEPAFPVRAGQLTALTPQFALHI